MDGTSASESVRAPQTLYLSGLIDLVNIQDPHYGKLHIGLHMVIVSRHTRLAVSSEKNTGAKQPDDNMDIPPSKRRKGKDPDNTIIQYL